MSKKQFVIKMLSQTIYRYTQVDADFYSLPKEICAEVINIIKKISIAGQSIFPNNWELAMTKKELIIKE